MIHDNVCRDTLSPPPEPELGFTLNRFSTHPGREVGGVMLGPSSMIFEGEGPSILKLGESLHKLLMAAHLRVACRGKPGGRPLVASCQLARYWLRDDGFTQRYLPVRSPARNR